MTYQNQWQLFTLLNLDTNMEEQIKAVQEYFKTKILSSDFEVKMVDAHYFKFQIDSKYNFVIWTGNPDIIEAFGIFQGVIQSSFMFIDFNIDEKQILKNIVMPYVNGFKRFTLLEQKRKELQDLEESLK